MLRIKEPVDLTSTVYDFNIILEFKLGDRVYTTISTKTGTYANFAVCSVLNGTVHHLSDNISFAAGACYGLPYFLGYRILARIARLPSGGNLLVKGKIYHICNHFVNKRIL